MKFVPAQLAKSTATRQKRIVLIVFILLKIN